MSANALVAHLTAADVVVPVVASEVLALVGPVAHGHPDEQNPLHLSNQPLVALMMVLTVGV